MIYFITGGERSGKSRFAQQLALSLSSNPAYLATAKIWDDDFKNRIVRHQQERDDRWTNIEEEINISRVNIPNDTVVLDCITLWLTNIFYHQEYATEKSLAFAKSELKNIFSVNKNWIIISNEIGMAVHPPAEIARKFVELQGWTNQYIAKHADKVYLMIAGIPVKIKPQPIGE